MGVAYQRIHGTAGERPLDRFESVEAGALLVLNAKLPNLAEPEFSRRVGKDCCVLLEDNEYSMPAALLRQNVSLQIRDQQVLIPQGGRTVALHSCPAANQRSQR